MSLPTLSPKSTSSKSILTSTGSYSNVTAANLPIGIYAPTGKLQSNDFVSGAVDQISYTYRKLGGDVLDIELSNQQVYAAYEESVLEYSYIVNLHQSKNMLSDVLGDTTGTFDHYGEYKTTDTLSSSLAGGNVALRYAKFDLGYARRMSDGISSEAGVGGSNTHYSASIEIEDGVQDYDLQAIVSSSAAAGDVLFSGMDRNRKILIRRIYYKSPRSMWRFYGYYGGIGIVGNLMNYGQFADDSTFQVIPTWQNKAQAAAFEDSINTRTSHYSYEIRNNKVRLFPTPTDLTPSEIWFDFTLSGDNWEEEDDRKYGARGINNMNTLPFSNIRFENINSIGKQWIRRFALALTKEMLGHVRGKFSSIPIPGESITLNASELISQSKEEQDKLREELKTILDELTYAKLIETDAAMVDNVDKILQNVPAGIFIG